jgi:hypothetical protein
MWVGLSDERTGLSFAIVTVSSSVCCHCTIYIVHFIECIYNIYKAFVSPGSIQQITPMNYSDHFAP